jgi:hypothetical protein
MDVTRPIPIPNDPVELVRQLDAGRIRQRLDDLSRERQALLVLLRAAQRGERQPRPSTVGGRDA